MKLNLVLFLVLLITSCDNVGDYDSLVNHHQKNIQPFPDTSVNYESGARMLHIHHSESLREVQSFDNKKHLYMISFYRNEKLDSVERYWFENDTLMWENNYKNGKLNGRCRQWNGEGKLIDEKYFENGKLIKGTEVHLDKNFLIDYVAIIENGEVIRKDSSQRGKPEPSLETQ